MGAGSLGGSSADTEYELARQLAGVRTPRVPVLPAHDAAEPDEPDEDVSVPVDVRHDSDSDECAGTGELSWMRDADWVDVLSPDESGQELVPAVDAMLCCREVEDILGAKEMATLQQSQKVCVVCVEMLCATLLILTPLPPPCHMTTVSQALGVLQESQR